MLEEKSHYTLTDFAKNAEEICERIYYGAVTPTLVRQLRPFAELRSVDDGGLPEDRNYVFVSLSDLLKSGGVREITRAFDSGNAVIVKDRPTKSRALSGRPNANIVVMTPVVK